MFQETLFILKSLTNIMSVIQFETSWIKIDISKAECVKSVRIVTSNQDIHFHLNVRSFCSFVHLFINKDP